jgi:hypothetical protein
VAGWLEAVAVDTVTLRVGQVEGAGVGAEGVVLNLGFADAASISVKGAVQGLRLADGTGLREVQGVGAEVQGTGRREGDHWAAVARLRLSPGQAYIDPWFLDLATGPVEASGEVRWWADTGRLRLERLRARLGDALRVEADTEVDLGDGARLREGRVALAKVDLGHLYPTYLQPPLRGTWLDRLAAEGEVEGELRWKGGRLSALRLGFQEAAVEDRDGRFGLHGLTGQARWDVNRTVHSSLQVGGGHVYRVALGAAQVEAQATDRSLRLTRPAGIPLLDGELALDSLELTGLGTPGWAARGDAVLTPVGLESLTAALGWPPLGGQISGVLPSLRYASGQVEVGGALLIRAFEGEVVIHNLRVRELFGPVPRLAADVDLRDLSLGPLTRAFSFGHIEGRLEGQVHGLKLEDWRPVELDARLQTPAGDHSQRRVSQEAVESLTRLGGASGAVSRAFLGLFREFSYARLGISCRLRQGVCEMDGVAPAEGGAYYIVQGGGLPPRIDVLGHNRRVDWTTLVGRLEQATRTGPPVVE